MSRRRAVYERRRPESGPYPTAAKSVTNVDGLSDRKTSSESGMPLLSLTPFGTLPDVGMAVKFNF